MRGRETGALGGQPLEQAVGQGSDFLFWFCVGSASSYGGGESGDVTGGDKQRRDTEGHACFSQSGQTGVHAC